MFALTSRIETPYHRVSAGVKLALLCLFTLGLYLTGATWIRVAALGCVAGLYLIPGISFAREALHHLKPLWAFVLIVALWHGATGTMIEGIRVILLLLAAVGLANLVTLTTRLDDMMGVVRFLGRPLRRLGIGTEALELSAALVIRYTPVLALKGRALAEAWHCRSPRRPGWRIAAPFVLLAIDDAEQVAEALRARGGFG